MWSNPWMTQTSVNFLPTFRTLSKFNRTKEWNALLRPVTPNVFLIGKLNRSDSSDAENSRSACFDWRNFIQTGIKYEILVHTRRWPVQARVAAIELKELPQQHRLVRWLVGCFEDLRNFGDISAISHVLEAGDNKFLKSLRRDCELNPGPLSPQAKSLTTTLSLLLRQRHR